MKKFAGKFMKEVIWDTAILSGLIIAPMLFLGPGWRVPVQRPFSELHRPAAQGELEELNRDINDTSMLSNDEAVKGPSNR